jgi:hypothetical protein
VNRSSKRLFDRLAQIFYDFGELVVFVLFQSSSPKNLKLSSIDSLEIISEIYIIEYMKNGVDKLAIPVNYFKVIEER